VKLHYNTRGQWLLLQGKLGGCWGVVGAVLGAFSPYIALNPDKGNVWSRHGLEEGRFITPGVTYDTEDNEVTPTANVSNSNVRHLSDHSVEGEGRHSRNRDALAASVRVEYLGWDDPVMWGW
jgi:hypothetical protein